MIEPLVRVVGKLADIGGKAVVDQGQRDQRKENIILGEINSTDKWLRRGRPAIIFTGLLIILLEILGIRIGLLMWFGASLEIIRNSTAMLEFFMLTWGSIVGVYMFKRPSEKSTQKAITERSKQVIKAQKVETRHQNKVNKAELRQTNKENQLANSSQKRKTRKNDK